jgi:wyosine [tRNA(Phe)-imidazoG37] synthetase (radical SAM superfamily)
MQTIELQQGILYGPVKSRRLGRSLGINLLPTSFKLCSFNCAYCQYGWTQALSPRAEEFRRQLPSVEMVLQALRETLLQNPNFDYLTFSGNGEPTLHPDFPQIVEMVRDWRDRWRPGVKLALLSNSTTCGIPKIRKAIQKIDLPIMKLDVGNELAFRRMNHGVPPITLRSIVDGLLSLERFVIQSMFVRGRVDNSTDREVKSWINRLKELHPLGVQIYSLDRGTANEKLQKVERQRLEEIARQATELTGLKIDVF